MLRISQPALSRQMQLLEQELGTKLFHRQGHGLVLTADGAVLLEHCARLLSQFESLRGLFTHARNTSVLTGTVGLGMPIPLIQMFAGSFLEQFNEKYPGIQLRMAEGFSALLHEWLLSGSMDLAMLYGVRPSKALVQERLLVEDLSLLVPADSDLAKRDGPIFLREIGDTPLILPHRPHALRDIVDRSGLKPNVIIEIDAFTLMVEMTRQGKGVTLLPRLSISQVLDNRVVGLTLADPGTTWEIALCYSALRPLSEAAEATRRAVRSEIKQLVLSGKWMARLTAEIDD